MYQTALLIIVDNDAARMSDSAYVSPDGTTTSLQDKTLLPCRALGCQITADSLTTS